MSNFQRVTQLEWQDLFPAVYKIHSWVDDGKRKLHAAIDYNVKEYVRMAREVRLHFIHSFPVEVECMVELIKALLYTFLSFIFRRGKSSMLAVGSNRGWSICRGP